MESPKDTARAKSPRRRSGQEVVKRLRDAASEEFSVNGYSRTKTATIAQRAGVSENLLFKHFGSKANLFNDTVFVPIEEHFARFSESHELSGDTPEGREAVSREYIGEMQAFIRQHAEQLLLLIMSSTFESAEVNGIDKVGGLHRYLEKTSSIVRDRLVHQSRIDPRLVAGISFGAIVACEVFRDWLFPSQWDEQDIKKAVVDFVLSGFKASISSPD